MRAPSDPEAALISVGKWLADSGYAFTTITPETHRRVVVRRQLAQDARDVFGWSCPFDRSLLPAEVIDALRVAGALDERELLASRIRFSSLGGGLFVHSAYPTLGEHAVFFGPDTYRFCAALATTVAGARRVVDLGAGSGAGGISLAERCDHVVLADKNPLAATYARVNAHLNRCADRVELAVGDLFETVHGDIDLVIANPPYLADAGSRMYCNGGGERGTELSIRIIEESIARLSPGGRLVMYTGSPICDGADPIRTAAARLLVGTRWSYRELDPDVFGEELDQPMYADVERIAAVLLVAKI